MFTAFIEKYNFYFLRFAIIFWRITRYFDNGRVSNTRISQLRPFMRCVPNYIRTYRILLLLRLIIRVNVLTGHYHRNVP